MNSLDRVKSCTKAALVLIAILAVLLALNNLLPLPLLIRNLFREGLVRTPVDVGTAFLLALTPLALAMIAVVFIRFREGLARRICRPIGNIPAT